MSTLAPSLDQLLLEAAHALAHFRAGRSLSEALDACPPAQRPGAQALVFAAVRAQGRCNALLNLLVPRRPPPLVDALLRVALPQLLPTATAYTAHTLVNQAVEAARRGAPAQAGMVNAVLRRFLREREVLLTQALKQAEARDEHPAWWSRRLRADWPAQADALLAAAQTQPPFSLRVNRAQGSRADYLGRLQAAGLQATPLAAINPEGLVLEPACPVQQLPGFDDGAVSVQDAAAQLAAPLLIDGAGTLPPLRPGARVLDACAAPGGKTAHLLELRPDLELLALDQDAQRLKRVGDTLGRLRLRAALQAADAGNPDAWWDGRPFDAILLDAPCSASGINRRHPDVRWLRRDSDIAQLAAEQRRLLDALWPLLRADGRLLFATCSLFKAEGETQAEAFAQRQPEAKPHAVPGQTGHLLGLPDNAGLASDGFFYALFCR